MQFFYVATIVAMFEKVKKKIVRAGQKQLFCVVAKNSRQKIQKTRVRTVEIVNGITVLMYLSFT